MFQVASFKIICTDSTEILFSKLRSAALNYHLPKHSFSLFLTVRGGGGGGGVFNKHYFRLFCLYSFPNFQSAFFSLMS